MIDQTKFVPFLYANRHDPVYRAMLRNVLKRRKKGMNIPAIPTWNVNVADAYLDHKRH